MGRILILTIILLSALSSEKPMPALASISAASIEENSPNGASVAFISSGAAANASIISNDMVEISILISDPTASGRLAIADNSVGILQRVTTSTASNGIVFRFSLASKCHVQVSASGSILRLTFAPIAGEPGLRHSPAIAQESTMSFKVVPLVYADPAEIAGVLVLGASLSQDNNSANQSVLVQPFSAPLGGTFVGGNQQVNNSFQPGTQQAPSGQRFNESVAIDRRTNAIILSGSEQFVTRAVALISALDIPLQSVLFETEIVELTRSAAENVGVDYSPLGSIGSAQLSTRSLNSASEALALQSVIYAEVRKGNGRIISRPRIYAVSGKSAQILSGSSIPVITSISFPGTAQYVQQQVQYVNVGITLSINTRVANGNELLATIFCQVSSVAGYTQGAPLITQRQAQTSAHLLDGESLIIGGLVEETELHNFTRVPLLSALPLIGSLFRLHQDSKQETNVYILVTPHILSLRSTNGDPR